MRTIRVTLLACALVLTAGAGAATSSVPTIRFFDLIPVKVRGAHFVAGERVKVTLKAGATTRVRTVRTAAKGGFVVGFGTISEKDRCSGSVAVAAVGAHGDRAFYKLPAMLCPAMARGTN
jgi:hypothetical protein